MDGVGAGVGGPARSRWMRLVGRAGSWLVAAVLI